MKVSPPRIDEQSAHAAEAPALDSRHNGPTRMLVLLLGLIGVWWLLIQRFGEGDVYAVIGPYAAAVSAVLIALRPSAIRGWLKPSSRAILVGLLVGAGMTLLTYPMFRLANSWWPELSSNVRGLYSGARSTSLIKATAWILAAILAEELLFRGVLPDVLSSRVSSASAYAISVVLYALAQYGTGSLIVLMIAAVCGSIWTAQRALTGSLLSSLIAHLIWTPTVILFFPVT